MAYFKPSSQLKGKQTKKKPWDEHRGINSVP